MDDHRFDDLARTVAQYSTRRTLLKAALGAALGAVGARTVAADAAGAPGHPGTTTVCRRHADCGPCHSCVRGRCRPTSGQRCGACGVCSHGDCTPFTIPHDPCGSCGRCSRDAQRCLPKDDATPCGECGTCKNGVCRGGRGSRPCGSCATCAADGFRCEPKPDGTEVTSCGVCEGGELVAVAGACLGREDACSTCDPTTFTCSAPVTCGPCEVCGQNGCERDDAVLCGAGKVCCPVSGACVDPRTDVTNCGACGRRCLPGEDCVRGRCIPHCPNGGACGGICCGDGEGCCGGSCEDPDANDEHCGRCGNACDTRTQRCHAGQCRDRCSLNQTYTTTCDEGGDYWCCKQGQQCCRLSGRPHCCDS